MGQRVGECCLAHPRHVLEQQVPAREDAGQAQTHLVRFAQNDMLDGGERPHQILTLR